MNIYYSGFVIAVEATLQLNGAVLTAEQLAPLTVTAVLMAASGRTVAIGTAAVTCTKSGTLVTATWPALVTAALPPGRYLVEYRTSDGPYCHEGVCIDIRAGVLP